MDTKPIKLTDFLQFDEPENAKLKFNIRPGDSSRPAWDLLLRDDPAWLGMLTWKTLRKHNMGKRQYLFAFAQYPYGPEYYIFGGLYRVSTQVPDEYDCHGYDVELMDRYSEYAKRLIIRINRPFAYNELYLRNYENVQEQLDPIVYEVRRCAALGVFPGYEEVCLTHHELESIVRNDEPEWHNNLSNVQAVYVITNRKDGRLYVGSATGDGGLWQRWSSYASTDDPTGGNKELVALRNERGAQYLVDNFQYSILEIFDKRTNPDTVRFRESYWKNALDTRAHGLNAN